MPTSYAELDEPILGLDMLLKNYLESVHHKKVRIKFIDKFPATKYSNNLAVDKKTHITGLSRLQNQDLILISMLPKYCTIELYL